MVENVTKYQTFNIGYRTETTALEEQVGESAEIIRKLRRPRKLSNFWGNKRFQIKLLEHTKSAWEKASQRIAVVVRLINLPNLIMHHFMSCLYPRVLDLCLPNPIVGFLVKETKSNLLVGNLDHMQVIHVSLHACPACTRALD